MEKRAGALIDINRGALEKRMKKCYDKTNDWQSIKTLGTGLSEDAARFDARKAREKVTDAEDYRPDHLLRYALRPFDTRWCYYSAERPLWNEPRPALWQQYWKGNSFLMSRPAGVASPEGFPLFYTPMLGDNDFLRGHAYYFPLRMRAAAKAKPKKKDDGNGEFHSILHDDAHAYHASKTTGNLSPDARNYLAQIGIKNPDADEETASLLWMHALAIGYSPAYLVENADGVRQDWPRIPLPESKAALLASGKLGKQVAASLGSETQLPGVDAGKIRPELVKIAVVTRLTKEALNLSLTAGWGHAGQNGVTMPGKGKLETRGYSAEEAGALGQSSIDLLGQFTHDIFLNEAACWRNVPEKVWDYTIGGYQVMKKWLSYREFGLLGRALTPDEAREVTHMARRIAALILLQPALDQNYLAVKANTVSWPIQR